MAFLDIPNIRVSGLAVTVPKLVKEIKDLPFFKEGEAQKVIGLTGIERTRYVPEGMTCSDLCYEAAEQLIRKLGWNKEEIGCLIYVSLSRDYVTPPTSILLQERLGLSKTCLCLDIPLACAGYVYALATASTFMSMGKINKGLILVGETTSVQISPLDKGLWPLQGDNGSATALEYDENAPHIYFNSGVDGSHGEAIIMPVGGTRRPFKEGDLEMKEMKEGSYRRNVDAIMDGMSVFSFAISEPPKTIKAMCERYGLEIEDIDYLLLHQANKYIDDKICKKLKVPKEKVPYCLKDYGNTSSGSIPLSMIVKLHDILPNQKAKVIMSGFGSGLAWGAAYLELDHIVCLPLIEIG